MKLSSSAAAAAIIAISATSSSPAFVTAGNKAGKIVHGGKAAKKNASYSKVSKALSLSMSMSIGGPTPPPAPRCVPNADEVSQNLVACDETTTDLVRPGSCIGINACLDTRTSSALQSIGSTATANIVVAVAADQTIGENSCRDVDNEPPGNDAATLPGQGVCQESSGEGIGDNSW
jgi:hypothetical protein